MECLKGKRCAMDEPERGQMIGKLRVKGGTGEVERMKYTR
ncbi:hypothetical protein AWRI1631_50450 [Saccharomyces cerevisiae AWRI1631]|uniref:Uncharacterized protein n=1 Tax=Saccharomyces cerevisiae (strain AWRI1631) TaxID=545124 RepID=B5VHB0_YEAS6|nr:hypothetical protein AWRI1631_50450 [Saccharomyces cerevisiae AWRI1631]